MQMNSSKQPTQTAGNLSTRNESGHVSQRRNQLSTTIGSVEKSHVNEVFGIMQLAYPGYLANTEPDDVKAMKRLWWKELEGHSAKKLDLALQRMTKEHKTFAPTLGEFLALLESTNTSSQPSMGLPICRNCRSYQITQRHNDFCVMGVNTDPVFTAEQIQQTKDFINALRAKRSRR